MVPFRLVCFVLASSKVMMTYVYLSCVFGQYSAIHYLCVFPCVCRMESAYRLWIKEKRESGRVSVESDHLCNELQAALSTAKWQVW